MTKFSLTVTLFILTLNLSACTSWGDKSYPTSSLTEEVTNLDVPETWAFSIQSEGVLINDWASILGDPQLIELIDRALTNNPSLRVSAENVSRAQALLNQARSNLFPKIDVGMSATGSDSLEGGSYVERYSGGLGASWEVDLWGSIRAGKLASNYDLLGTRALFEGARQSLIASVARSYILIIETEQQISLSQQTLTAQEETLRIVKIRYELGAASKRELVLAESDVASARDNLVVATSAKTDAILALQILLGEYPDGELTVPKDFPKIAETFPVGTPSELLRRRPDIITAEFDVLSAFETTRSTRTDGWPTLALTGSLDTSSNNLDSLFNPVSMAYNLGVRLADTLFDGGLTQSRIDAANANQRASLASYGQTVLNAYSDVESSLNTIETINKRVILVQENADAAREALTLAEVQYKEGAIDLLDVLTFRQRSFQADRSQITLERQSLEARIALYLALGGTGVNTIIPRNDQS